MKDKSIFERFTGKYALSKTLRFELKPQGKTLEHIEKKGLITQDEGRAKSYKEMKKTIDGFHKHFIEMAMSQANLTQLESFAELYNAPAEQKKEDNFKKAFEKVQADLRKEIAKGFNTGEAKEIFFEMFKKKLITELLEEWIKTRQGEDIYFDEEFKKFSTYFYGFHENRKNMYTDKEQSTAIAYRLVHENLPKFMDNIKIFDKVKARPNLYEKCQTLYKEIEEYLNIIRIDDAFKLGYYNDVLTQKQIDVYNLIIGGRAPEEGKKKIQGLNEYINLYNQKQEKKDRIPKLKPLFKQILSDRESISFLPDIFEESQEVLDAIEDYYKAHLIDFKPEDKDETENVLEKIHELLADLKAYDLNKIYIRNDKAITDISKALFGDWGIIKSALGFAYTQALKVGKNGLSKKQEKEIEKYLEQPHYSTAEIEDALFKYRNENETLRELQENTNPVADYFHTYFLAEKKKEDNKKFNLIANINARYSCIKEILNKDYPKNERLNQETIDDIKAFLDSLMELLHFVKPLALPNDSALEKDENFYSLFGVWYGQLQLLIPLYNKVRNYVTQKPYSTEKFKLNFENSHFLSGWASEYSTKGGLIVKKDGNFYLTIVEKKLSDEDIAFLKENIDSNPAKRVVYDFQKPDNKNVPRLFIRSKGTSFAPAVEKYNLPIQSVLDIYDNGYFKTEYRKIDSAKFKESLSKMIGYFKEGFTKHESYSHYDFDWKKNDEYEDISEFYNDVTNSCYQLYDEEINFDNLLKLVDQGKVYLFQIYNKDFSPYSKGKPNLHTMYWKALFEPENLKNVVYKLNGQAEMFYRRKSVQDGSQVVHKANEPIANKNPNAKKKESIFEYDITKDKRYTLDKFQFHVPITMNFKATGNEYINTDVLEYLKNNPHVNIIGIDRGERHLIYLTLVDQQGNIIRQESLNTIVNKEYNMETPYHKLLDRREGERDKARKDWGTIETIKELKEGYISQVVHKIARMMVEHNAIVVMEDLNFGFKRGRFKVEKQVYQKLEKMLIDKLNYLVFKDKASNERGGLYHALQLTNKFTSFKDLGKQSGFLFYVPAWNTSKIDPTTGFVSLFNTKYENVEKAKIFFRKFESIRYNSEKDYFEFVVKEYSLFNPKADGTKQDWIISTHGDRIITFRNPEKNSQWDNKEVVLTDEFKSLFKKYNISYKTNLQGQIASQSEKVFFEKLLQLFKLTLQMRNSITGSKVDYLISPVMNGEGKFYDSRTAGATLPDNADANGAYHIALKGLWCLHQIRDTENLKKVNLSISNREWLRFTQERAYIQ